MFVFVFCFTLEKALKKSKLDSNLERIAYIFSAIGIGSDEEAIRIVRNKNPGFVYPLKQD